MGTGTRILQILPFIIGFALLVGVLHYVNPNAVLTVLQEADALLLLAGLAVTVGNIFLKTWKWKILLDQQHPTRFQDAIRGWLGGFALGLFTPGKIGEVARAKFIPEQGSAPVTAAVLLDRVLDLAVILGLAVLAVGGVLGGSLTILVIAFLVVVGGSAVFAHPAMLQHVITPLAERSLPETYQAKGSAWMERFHTAFSALFNRRLLLTAGAATIAAWMVQGVFFYLLTEALTVNMSIITVFAFLPLLTIAELLPVSVAGAGTRDITAVALFQAYGFSETAAVSFSVLVLAYTFVVAAGGALIWMQETL